jgi:hypothetical protein
MLKRLKRLSSYAAYARYLSECEDTPYEIPRQPDIPCPYRYSPTHTVYAYQGAVQVIIVETAHKRFDVFAVPEGLLQPKDNDS